eukprot:GHVU01179781.1.p1 GENE.GHVU01179781.1~~GHVU01179781.1.p1  ORF type:complete len:138 (+),score=11.33 GHVU01179781.1:267-680(+)
MLVTVQDTLLCFQHYAARNGHVKVCELLLRKGADVNAATRSGKVTALHRAAYCSQLGVVNLLIKWRTNTLLCDSDGKCALHKAAEKGNVNIIKELLKADSSCVDIIDNQGHTAEHYLPKDSDEAFNVIQKYKITGNS